MVCASKKSILLKNNKIVDYRGLSNVKHISHPQLVISINC